MMTFYSTNNRELKASLKEAVLSGLAPDGGLYMPESITPLSSDFFRKIHSMSFQEILEPEVAVILLIAQRPNWETMGRGSITDAW